MKRCLVIGCDPEWTGVASRLVIGQTHKFKPNRWSATDTKTPRTKKLRHDHLHRTQSKLELIIDHMLCCVSYPNWTIRVPIFARWEHEKMRPHVPGSPGCGSEPPPFGTSTPDVAVDCCGIATRKIVQLS